MTVYWFTLAPGLTWANQGADGGDLIAAAATGGVAHPTGYPVYLLFARLFQMAPIGSLAYRTNLLSALAIVFAGLLVYRLVVRSSAQFQDGRIWLAGLASAYALGFSPLVWSQAVITEVYTLHALFVAAVLTLSNDQAGSNPSRKRNDGLLGLVFGLSMGNHVSTILLAPLLLASALRAGPASTSASGLRWKFRPDGHTLFRRLAWMAAGLSIYLTLPLRAASQPPVNWGDPVTLDGFLWLITGRLYKDELFMLSASALWNRPQAFAALLLEQFGIVGLIVGLIGLVVHFKPTRLYHNTIWVFTSFSVFAIGYGTEDSLMHLIPAFLSFAIWIGLGLKGMMDAVDRWRPNTGFTVGLVLILYLFAGAGAHWAQVDASKDLRAERFAQAVLEQTPDDAIVFAKGDQAVFALWYFHYALQERPDIAVIAADLLPHPWYQETLRRTYPDVRFPAYFPFPEAVIASNPDRFLCYIRYDRSPQITCTN